LRGNPAVLANSLRDTHLQTSDGTFNGLPINEFPFAVPAERRISKPCGRRHLLSFLQRFHRLSRNRTPAGVILPPAGRQLPFGPGKFRTRIRSITDRPSLLPASCARTSNSVPCGFTCRKPSGEDTGFPRSAQLPITSDLGLPSIPAVQHSRMGSYETHNLTATPFGPSLTASLACSH
jgi:hypothetical protein